MDKSYSKRLPNGQIWFSDGWGNDVIRKGTKEWMENRGLLAYHVQRFEFDWNQGHKERKDVIAWEKLRERQAPTAYWGWATGCA